MFCHILNKLLHHWTNSLIRSATHNTAILGLNTLYHTQCNLMQFFYDNMSTLDSEMCDSERVCYLGACVYLGPSLQQQSHHVAIPTFGCDVQWCDVILGEHEQK